MKIYRISNKPRKVFIGQLDEAVSCIPELLKYQMNVISLRDSKPGTNQAKYDKLDSAGIANLLAITIDDIEEDIIGMTVPSINNIQMIIDWARQKMQENNKAFFIHCTAGISRSSAIATLVSYIQNPETAYAVLNPEKHRPNKKILDIGGDILNDPTLKDNVMKKINKQEGLSEDL